MYAKSLAVLALLSCSACTGVAGGGDGDKLTVEECRRYYSHTYSLDNMDAAKMLGEEGLERDSKTCSEAGSVTRRHFDCAVAAKSLDALQACGAPNT